MKECNNPVDAGYNAILADIRDNGRVKQERNAVCHSVFGATLRSNCKDGFPLVTGKFTAFKPILTEWLGMLNGNTSVAGLGKVWGQWGLKEDHTVARYTSRDEYIDMVIETMAFTVEEATEIAEKAIETGVLTLNTYNTETKELQEISEQLQPEVVEAGVDRLVTEIMKHQASVVINERVLNSNVDVTVQNEVSIAIVAIANGLDIDEEVNDYRELTRHGDDTVVITDEDIDAYLSDRYDNGIIRSTVVHEEGYLGPVYGAVWRGLVDGVDQILQLEKDIKAGGNRRMLIDGWVPTLLPDPTLSHKENILNGKQVLPPCHVTYVFDLYDGEISVEMLQRSGDMLIGIPFNHGHLGLWLESLAAVHGLTALQIKHDITNAHVYSDQLDVITLDEYLERDTFELPEIKINIREGVTSITELVADDFEVVGYQHAGKIDLPVTS